jgi:hypothetical protein
MGTYEDAVVGNCVTATDPPGGALEALKIVDAFRQEAATAAGTEDPATVLAWLVQRAVQVCRGIGVNIEVQFAVDTSNQTWVFGSGSDPNDHTGRGTGASSGGLQPG